MGQAINSEIIYKFGNYTVTRVPIEINTFEYYLTNGGIWIGRSQVVENPLTYCLVLTFEIFPQFRRQGHGSAFLGYLTSHLLPQEIKLFPLAPLSDLDDKSHEEIVEAVEQNKEALKIKTERLISFYSKNGFKWDKSKEYLVFN